MNQLMIKKKNELTTNKKKGFTLVELIIVIAIIAILAAIAIPKFGAVRENSNKSSDLANAKNIYTAVANAIAEGEIDYSTAIVAAGLNSVDSYDVTTQIDGLTETTNLRTAGHTNDVFQVSVDTTGNITVTAGTAVGTVGDEVYPTTNEDFK